MVGGRVAAALCAATVALAQSQDIQRPLAHVMPISNWMNDPNGPMFYNGVYHLFYQYNPFGAVWGNMSWGHAASSDLVTWIHLPVALWPNNTYDVDGVFSGSATIVNGSPVISYTCVGPAGELQCLAYPKDNSDPYLIEWVKDSGNPVIAGPPPGGDTANFRDDTTAWRDAVTGNWLMGVGCSAAGGAAIALYESLDFHSWTFSNFMWTGPESMWECPDFFPLYGSDGLYLAKYSQDGDWFAVGNYDETTRTFTPMTAPAKYDAGQYYASKRFDDVVNQRQVLWGWVAEEDNGASRGWQSVQSLPRVIMYDPLVQTIRIEPIPELAQLRNATLASLNAVALEDGTWSLIPAAEGMLLEIDAYIAIPAVQPTTEFSVGFALRATPSGGIQTRVGMAVAPGAGPFNNTDEPGGDYRDFASDPNATEAHNVANCSAQCGLESECVAWTYVRPGYPAPPIYPAPRCSLKSTVPAQKPGSPCCVSGVKGGTNIVVDRSQTSGDGPQNVVQAALKLVEGERLLRLHIFLDHSMLEVFGQSGRTRTTARIYPTDPTARYIAMYANGINATIVNATIWSLNTIWQ